MGLAACPAPRGALAAGSPSPRAGPAGAAGLAGWRAAAAAEAAPVPAGTLPGRPGGVSPRPHLVAARGHCTEPAGGGLSAPSRAAAAPARVLRGAVSVCTAARVLHGAVSVCTPARVLRGAVSVCTAARVLHGAVSVCTPARVLQTCGVAECQHRSCWLSARTSSGASSWCTAKSLARTRALGHTSTSSLPTSAGQCHSPGNHRVKTVCENDKLRLQCRPKSILAIYSANYGRFLRGKPECDSLNTGGPHIECLAPDALRRVSKKCHRKGNCTVAADQATFGDPCLPGMKKQLRVSYTCVPKQLLEEVGPDTSDPFLLSDYMHGIPEKVGLYFLCGVSGGLMVLLCIISPKTTFLQEVGEALKDPELESSLELSRTKLRDEQDEDLPDDSSSDSSFRHLTRTYRATDSIFSPELTAAMEGAVEHQGCAGEEIWMPKESSPYAIHKIKSATK
ncbi:protein eva-1 homolog C-like isoform X2 [Falco biarmicus]|uniref:protein eva-1 homolog C-like isoform X2 n=1 Tax=Falco biarmicus TaxID=345155 RepID=UPI0024BCEE26|nr:protein eva-1 homolog C-like isoform X2 [Falco biarmicus]